MKIKTLIKNLNIASTSGSLDAEITGISCNSKEVKKGFVFVAIKGSNLDGYEFIQEAIDKGASCVVAQKDFKTRGKIARVFVKNTKKALIKLAIKFYDNPSRKIKLIGITGTNGKTTVSHLVESILKQSGFNTGLIGTISYRFGRHVIDAKNTTPGALELQSIFSGMVKEGIDYAVMEVSSHSIDQRRIEGLEFDAAIFTNISAEHLDYHHSMQDYKNTKARLFTDLPKEAFAVLNTDDELGMEVFKKASCKKLTYAVSQQADVELRTYCIHDKGLSLEIATPKGRLKIESALFGRYNIYNILAAVSAALTQGIALEKIKKGIEDVNCIPGRLQKIGCAPYTIFIDYAHTEDALENVLFSLKEVCKRKIITVFGCGGDRDKLKRPKMGKVASRLSDFIFITTDNPRTETPASISREILNGIKKNSLKATRVILDREEAIKEAIGVAKAGDCILIAGKGHEKYQVLKDRTVPFDDCEVVRSCLQSKK